MSLSKNSTYVPNPQYKRCLQPKIFALQFMLLYKIVKLKCSKPASSQAGCYAFSVVIGLPVQSEYELETICHRGVDRFSLHLLRKGAPLEEHTAFVELVLMVDRYQTFINVTTLKKLRHLPYSKSRKKHVEAKLSATLTRTATDALFFLLELKRCIANAV